jgi:hypothetical protein
MAFIDPYYFLIALFFGLFMAYISTPVPDIVIKYPTPDNAGKVIYRDSADVCYKYQANVIKCPKDESKIKKMKFQHIDPSREQTGALSNFQKMWQNK